MAAPSQTLSKHSQDETSFSFDTFTLMYQGGTHVPLGSTVLRLTKTDPLGKPIPYSVGRVLYSLPIKFLESSLPIRQASFESTITFKVTPSNDGAADGLAFFIAPFGTTIPSGSAGGNLGIFGRNGITPHLFAVEFDNFVNEWDPKERHIGIDIESRVSVITAKFDSGTGELVTAHIKYNSKTNIISVVATSGQQTATLNYARDLSTILPQQVQVGISSAAGEMENGVYDVISWSFRSYYD
ncbi:hypothetical protein ACS0TY_035291 [Phlomoides rotata]